MGWLTSLPQRYGRAFRGLPRETWLVCVGFLINRAGTMVVPFLALYATAELGYSKETASGLLVAFGLGSVLGSYLGGRLTARLGPLRVQKLSLVAAGGSFLLLGQLRSYPALLLGIFLVALASDALRPAAFTAVAEFSPMAVRTRAIALLRLMANLGISVGPAVGGMLAGWSYRWLFVADGITCWLAALFLHRALGSREPTPRERPATVPPPTRRSVWSDRPYLAFLVVVFCLYGIFFQFIGTLPLYLNEAYSLPESRIGLLLSLNAVLIVLTEMALVSALETRDATRVFGLGCLLTCTGFALLPLGSTVAFAALTIIVWTVGEMISLPFGYSAAVARADRNGSGSGEYIGLHAAAGALAMFVAPATGLWVYAHLGPETLWYGIGILGPVLGLACLVLAPILKRP
jgi:predicted MFS family arabinose efflux permease